MSYPQLETYFMPTGLPKTPARVAVSRQDFQLTVIGWPIAGEITHLAYWFFGFVV
jgi:hypothetical protein